MTLRLYTQGGKLLVEDSMLASSADCCCDDDPIVKCCILGKCVEVRSSECAFHGGVAVNDCEDCEPQDPLSSSTCADCCPNNTELLVRITSFFNDLETGGTSPAGILRFGRLGQSMSVSAELLIPVVHGGGLCRIEDAFCVALGTFGGQFSLLKVSMRFVSENGGCLLLEQAGVGVQVSLCQFLQDAAISAECGESSFGGNAFSGSGSPDQTVTESVVSSSCVGMFSQSITRIRTWPSETNTRRGPYLGNGILREPGQECADIGANPLPFLPQSGDLAEASFTFTQTTLVTTQPAPP